MTRFVVLLWAWAADNNKIFKITMKKVMSPKKMDISFSAKCCEKERNLKNVQDMN